MIRHRGNSELYSSFAGRVRREMTDSLTAAAAVL
jgi:hypothetical protein